MGELAGAVSLTRHPYDIFAAAQLGVVIDSDDSVVRSTDALSGRARRRRVHRRRPRHWRRTDQHGVPSRRLLRAGDDESRRVGAGRAGGSTRGRPDTTRRERSACRPATPGRTTFPGTPSKLVGLGLSAAHRHRRGRRLGGHRPHPGATGPAALDGRRAPAARGCRWAPPAVSRSRSTPTPSGSADRVRWSPADSSPPSTSASSPSPATSRGPVSRSQWPPSSPGWQ